MNLSNFHTHTIYCDGNDTIRELIEKAIGSGCRQIGFSGHAAQKDEKGEYLSWCMSEEDTVKYKSEIRRLREEYSGKIDILMGIEMDYFSCDTSDDYDYVIGSVHYVYKDGVYLAVDESKEILLDAVREYYNGDIYEFIRDYYELEGDIYNRTGCDIVGHFDLITKFNEDRDLFDTNDERYIAASDMALNKLMNKGLIFEINYGAIARGYRTDPYPEQRFVDILVKSGEKMIETSDCHSKENLLFGIKTENNFYQEMIRKNKTTREKDLSHPHIC